MRTTWAVVHKTQQYGFWHTCMSKAS